MPMLYGCTADSCAFESLHDMAFCPQRGLSCQCVGCSCTWDVPVTNARPELPQSYTVRLDLMVLSTCARASSLPPLRGQLRQPVTCCITPASLSILSNATMSSPQAVFVPHRGSLQQLRSQFQRMHSMSRGVMCMKQSW